MPLRFVINEGQFADDIRFAAQSPGFHVGLTQSAEAVGKRILAKVLL
jgi:hypothetical protein